MSISPNIKTKIINYFGKRPEVAAVYLYGSQARKSAKETSDIDLAVLVTDKRKYKGFAIPQVVFSQDLLSVTDKEVEVQDLTSCRIDFAHRVLTEGKLLISNNQQARIAFEENIFRTYFDMKPAFDEYDYYQKLRQKNS